jgi:hypothetical protein
MRIEVLRSGGFANIWRRAEIDTDELPPDRAEEYERLVAGIDFDAVKRGTSPSGADRFVYDVRIERDAGTEALHVSEADAPPALRELISHVLAEQRGR